ncbi:MAG: retropepsin-like aspartic protease [Candidatus Omnitrophota bacterium]|jgi:clan AA aspartic protease (TIGR02281 family)
MITKALLLLLISLAVLHPAVSDEERGPDVVVILLRNGGVIEGVVRQETEEGIVVDPGYGTVAFSKSEIESIKRPEKSEKQDKLRSWRRKKIAIQKAGTPEAKKKNLRKFYEREKENLRVARERIERIRRGKDHRIKFLNSSKIDVETIINDRVEITLLLDTGAHSVLIPLEIAEKLKDVNLDTPRKVNIKLADGTVREGTPIMLKSVKVAGLRAENVPAVTMDLKGGQGLLGMSFLNRFHLKVDFKNNELILEEKEEGVYPR